MIKKHKQLFFLAGSVLISAVLVSCGAKTNPEEGYSTMVSQSVPASQAKAATEQYMCGAGFTIQARGHGNNSDLRFASGTATSFTIELVKPFNTPGLNFKLQASGPQGSHFTLNNDPSHPELVGSYNFSWSPPSAGQNASGVSKVLQVSLNKTGDESQLDPKVKTCLDRSVTPVNFNLLVDGAGKAFDVSVIWPDNTPTIQEGSEVPFSIDVTDETATQGNGPHLEVGRIANSGNELNAEDGSSFVTCPSDDKAVSQGNMWVYNCTFSVKSGSVPKQASSHKTQQNVQTQVVVGYRILAHSADGKLPSDFNDRRIITYSAPSAPSPTQVGKK
jgi:hypothetical protein